MAYLISTTLNVLWVILCLMILFVPTEPFNIIVVSLLVFSANQLVLIDRSISKAESASSLTPEICASVVLIASVLTLSYAVLKHYLLI